MDRKHPGLQVHRLARLLRRNRTSAEAVLWTRLRQKQLAGFRFRRQFPIGNFIADFCCRDRGLVVELDGSQHGDDPARVVADDERTSMLQKRGYRVIGFWNDEVLTNLNGVVEQILVELKR